MANASLCFFVKVILWIGGENMNSHRAQEISNSKNMISVSYNGDPVYIEHVDQSNGHVTIHPLDDPTSKQSVAVTELIEQ